MDWVTYEQQTFVSRGLESKNSLIKVLELLASDENLLPGLETAIFLL